MSGHWPERIVVGIDASPEASIALVRALELGARAGSTVVAVHAVGLLERANYVPHFDLSDMIRRANQTAGCPAELIAAPRSEVGHAPDVLVRVADQVGGDLIVVGRRGEGQSWRPLGSTSEAVLDTATVPVLVVTPHDAQLASARAAEESRSSP